MHYPKRLSDRFISCLTEGTFYKKDYGKRFKYPKKLEINLLNYCCSMKNTPTMPREEEI